MSTTPIDYTDYAEYLYSPTPSSRDEISPQNNYVILLMQRQPYQLTTNKIKAKSYNLHTDFEYVATDDSSTIITHKVKVGSYEKSQTVTGNAASPTWTTTDKALIKDAVDTGLGFNPIGDNDQPSPKFVVVNILSSYVADETSDIAAISNVWFDHKPDNSSSHTAIQCSTTGNESLPAPDYPVSAWHIKKLNIDSLNAIMTRCLQAITVPMFGTSDDE